MRDHVKLCCTQDMLHEISMVVVCQPFQVATKLKTHSKQKTPSITIATITTIGNTINQTKQVI